MTTGQKIGYVRVSSLDQNEQRQLDGVQLDKTFTDKASGKDTNRPQLQEAISYARSGDMLIIHSMDRLARNLNDLREIVAILNAKGVVVQFVKENLTFKGNDDAMQNLMLNIMGAFAEFERNLIRERQREGIALAKARGAYKGRALKLTSEAVQEVKKRVDAGESKAALARELNISRETLYAYLRRAA